MRLPTKYTHKGYNYLEWAQVQNAYHCGIDFNYGSPREDLGLPLYAFKAGKVVHTSQKNSGYGNLVVLKHSENEYSKYAHLNTINVKEGQKIDTFFKMAEIGSTGTNSPHLHFEITDQHIIKQGYRYYPSGENKDFVKKHYKNPLEYIMPKQLKVHIVADDVPYIDKYIDWIEDYFLKHSADQLKLDIEVEHVEVATNVEEDGDLDISWFFDNYRDDFEFKDIAIYCTDNEDWKKVDAGGYHKDDKIMGLEIIFMHAEDHKTRNFADIKHEFKGRIAHEIMHSLYNMSGKEMPENDEEHVEGADNTHYWDYEQKNLHKALTEINYDELKLNPLTKNTMFDLIQEKNTRHVYAVDGDSYHYIKDVNMLERYDGKLWNRDEIQPVDQMDDDKEGEPLILPTN